jgi:hypothetical protein
MVTVKSSAGQRVVIDASQSVQTQNLHNVTLGGNTAGVMAQISSGTMILAGGNNITLSQNGNAVTIIGASAGGAGISGIAGSGASTVTAGIVQFANSNGITFGLNGNTITGSVETAYLGTGAAASFRYTSADSQLRFTSNDSQLQMASAMSNYQTAGAYLTTAALSQNTSNYAGINGAITGGSLTVNTAGVSINLPTYLSTAMASNAGVRWTSNDSQLRFASDDSQLRFTSNDSQLQFTSGMSNYFATSNNTFFVSANSTQLMNTSERANYFATSNNTFQVMANSTLSLGTGATASFQYTSANTKFIQEWSFIGAQTSGTISSVQGSRLYLSGGNMITLYGNSNTIVFSLNSASLLGTGAAASFQYTSATSLITSNALNTSQMMVMSLGGNSGTTGSSQISTGGYVLAGGANITINQSNNSVSIQGAAPGGTTFYSVSRWMYPDHMLSQVSAPVNASVSVQMVQIPFNLSASRADIFVYQSISSSAVGNTYGQQWSIYCGIYTNNTGASNLQSVSSGSTQTTWTVASNTAGATQINGSGIRPVSCPININATPGQYFMAWDWVTNTFSSGTATTALNRTVSIMGGAQIQSASNALVSDYNIATGATRNWLMPMGVFSAASTGLPGTISYSQFTATGASVSQANIVILFRNN